MAMLFMLGVVVVVLGSFLIFIGYLMYMSSQADDGMDELAEVAYQANPDGSAA